MDQRPSETDSSFKTLLEDLKQNIKIELGSSLLRTAYAREEVGKDNDKREEQLDSMNKTLEKILKEVSGENTEQKKLTKDSEESQPITLKDELKSFIAGVGSITSGVATIVKNPIKAARIGAKQAGRAIESAVTSFENILETPKEFSVQKQYTAKETPAFTNPEADNIETPQEKIADAAEDNLKIQEQLLNTTKQSLIQLIAIKDALSAPQRETSVPKAKETPQIVDQTGSPIGSSMDINIEKGKTPLKIKPEVKPQSKSTLGSRVGGALKGAGKAALGAGRFLGPIGAIAGATVGAVQGVGRAGDIFGVEEGKEATLGQKTAAAVGGIADPFGLGYGDTLSKSVFGIGEKTGGFFSGIKDTVIGAAGTAGAAVGGVASGIKDKISSTAQYLKDEYNRDLSGKIGVPLSEQKGSTNQSMSEYSQTGKGGALEKQDIQEGITAQKSLFGSSFLGSMFSKEGQTTGQFLSNQENSERFTGDAAALGLGSDLGVDYEKRKSSSLLGERISSGSMFKRDKYKVTDTESGQDLNVTKDEYKKFEALVAEGKAEQSQKLFDQIKAREAAYVPEKGITPEEQMVAPSRGSSNLAMVTDTSTENAAIKDELAASRGTIQPFISNNVSNTSTNNFIPIKGEPRATHKGSALERYNERVTAY